MGFLINWDFFLPILITNTITSQRGSQSREETSTHRYVHCIHFEFCNPPSGYQPSYTLNLTV